MKVWEEMGWIDVWYMIDTNVRSYFDCIEYALTITEKGQRKFLFELL